jgi:hypothetical protein
MTDQPILQVINTIICDDVRREDNGKDILIGVFNDSMVVEVLPALLPTFGIRFLMKAASVGSYKIESAVSGPDGKEMVKLVGDLSFSSSKYLSSFSFKVSPMVINAIGKHEITFGVHGQTKVVHTFEVITREQLNAETNPKAK